MPGHLTSFKVGGHFGAKGSSLNDRGAGDPIRRFNYASERSRSGTWSHHRHTESCKPNKTKQNNGLRAAWQVKPASSRPHWVHRLRYCAYPYLLLRNRASNSPPALSFPPWSFVPLAILPCLVFTRVNPTMDHLLQTSATYWFFHSRPKNEERTGGS